MMRFWWWNQWGSYVLPEIGQQLGAARAARTQAGTARRQATKPGTARVNTARLGSSRRGT